MSTFLKLITIWAFLINSAFGQGDPAPFVKGVQSTGLGNSASTVLVPNNQSTKINAYQALVETGNKNLLVNPSFEHSTVTTGWTISNATATSSSSAVDGKKALSLSLTGALSVLQDSTINATNISGLQGLTSIKIKTSDVDGLKVCARNNGTTSSTLCISVPKDGAWKEIAVPYIFTSTSNGLAVTSTGTTGTVLIDDASMGTSLPISSNTNISGWQSYTPTFGAGFGSPTNINFKWQQIGDSIEVIGTFTAGATLAADFGSISLPTGYTIDATKITQTNVRTSAGVAVGEWSNNSTGASGRLVTAMGTANNLVYVGGNFTGSQSVTPQATINGAWSVSSPTTFRFKVPVTGLDQGSKLYSQASQDYGWISFTPTSPNSSITFTSPSCYHKREGSDLLIRCNSIIGAGGSSGSTAQMALPNSLTTSSTLSTSSIAGMRGIGTNSATSSYVMVQPSVSYLTFSNQGSAANTQTLLTGASIADAQQQTLYARIPISGWSDYGVIVGRFNDTVNDYGAIKPVSKKASLTCTASSAIISQGLGSSWVSTIGNIASGACAVTLNSGIFNTTPICQITERGNNASTNVWKITESSSTSISLYCSNGGANCTTGASVNIACEGVGI